MNASHSFDETGQLGDDGLLGGVGLRRAGAVGPTRAVDASMKSAALPFTPCSARGHRPTFAAAASSGRQGELSDCAEPEAPCQETL